MNIPLILRSRGTTKDIPINHRYASRELNLIHYVSLICRIPIMLSGHVDFKWYERRVLLQKFFAIANTEEATIHLAKSIDAAFTTQSLRGDRSYEYQREIHESFFFRVRRNDWIVANSTCEVTWESFVWIKFQSPNLFLYHLHPAITRITFDSCICTYLLSRSKNR